jgi:hypothetical protein
MLKVLIPINEFPTDINNIRGGVHAALKNLLIGFSKKDIIVRVISFNKEIKQNIKQNFSDNIEILYKAIEYLKNELLTCALLR